MAPPKMFILFYSIHFGIYGILPGNSFLRLRIHQI